MLSRHLSIVNNSASVGLEIISRTIPVLLVKPWMAYPWHSSPVPEFATVIMLYDLTKDRRIDNRLFIGLELWRFERFLLRKTIMIVHHQSIMLTNNHSLIIRVLGGLIDLHVINSIGLKWFEVGPMLNVCTKTHNYNPCPTVSCAKTQATCCTIAFPLCTMT